MNPYLKTILDLLMLTSWSPLMDYGVNHHVYWMAVLGLIELIVILFICIKYVIEQRAREKAGLDKDHE